MFSRSTNYRVDEDILLCQFFLDISQDPITGINQTKSRLWNRVTQLYNETKDASMEERSFRSLETRFKTIELGVRRLIQCIKKVELFNPSGASQQDILQRAKLMFVEDVKFKAGFKFDHVWNMLKNFEKFLDSDTTRRQVCGKHSSDYSSSDNQTPDCNTPESPGFSPFSMNLNDDNNNIGGSSYDRPTGVKKAKLKKKVGEQREKKSKIFSEEIKEMLKKAEEERLQLIDYASKGIHLSMCPLNPFSQVPCLYRKTRSANACFSTFMSMSLDSMNNDVNTLLYSSACDLSIPHTEFVVVHS
ncbi:hypothetical protein BUALT_Bualt10G0068500 [Buddleja alternifolia]|uniref:No apical meristem-associated C-terminal domain-containing protein n=1 Tax=Buddleja alternifolia TaxID=168488 RepID=A0AAV6WVU1_9LAMI|nr:hypothetical protein BUALT_Bualt10G0068500 [Buddleja alternifolia]